MALDAGEERELELTIAVPTDAVSGVHIGGVAAWVPEVGLEPDDDDAPISVDVQRRRVVAVQLVLPGPAEPILRVTGVEPAARADGVYLLIGIINEGRGFATGEGVIEVDDPAFRQEFRIDTFVPDTEIAYPVRFADDAPEREYAARVSIDYGMWSEEWEGTVVVGPQLTEELEDRSIAVERSFPWWVVAAVVLATLAGAAAWMLVRRQRTRPAFPAGQAAPARAAEPPASSPTLPSTPRPPPPSTPAPPPPGTPTGWSIQAPPTRREE